MLEHITVWYAPVIFPSMPHNISSTRQVPESHWLEVTTRVGWPLLRFFSGLTHSTSCSIFGQVTWDTADFNWHFWISIFQFRGVCWIRGSVIGVNILDQSPASKSLVCLFTVGIRILFEESHDGKREMAAEISQPVTLTSIFFLYRVVTQRSSPGALRGDYKNRLRTTLQPWSKLLGH